MVSVVIPTYNVEKYIGAAIESVLAQTYIDWELIIVDDCSTDNTVAMVEKYQKQNEKIRLIKRSFNSGGARKPRYDGILAAQGQFVTHIDSDDFIECEYLQKMLNRKNETEADLILSKLQYCGEHGEADVRQIPVKEFDFNAILSGEQCCGMTIGRWQVNLAGLLMNTERYQEFVSEIYDEDCNSCFNDELDYRKLLLSVQTVAFSQATYFYRQHEMSVVHLPLSQFVDRLNQVMPLYTFISEHIQDEAIIRKLKNDYIQSLYLAESTFQSQKKSLSGEERNKARANIRQAYSFLKKNKIKGIGMKFSLISKSYVWLRLLAWVRNIVVKLR